MKELLSELNQGSRTSLCVKSMLKCRAIHRKISFDCENLTSRKKVGLQELLGEVSLLLIRFNRYVNVLT